jgi:Pyridoxamine 5'-phosphate oxidase
MAHGLACCSRGLNRRGGHEPKRGPCWQSYVIMGRVTAWRDVERAEPEFAQRVQALSGAHRHKTIATLRAGGSPRISGIEAAFEDGALVFGSMPDARKGAGLRRDPRFALHSATVDPVEGFRGAVARGRRRSPAGRSLPDRSPKDRTATASAPTSPRSCAPTSTSGPRCSSSSGGHPGTGCEGSAATDR